MSGISRLLAKELSSALGIIDNPKYNKMFKETEEVLPDVADPADPTVARFYSPLESAIENAPIGKEGTRGENIEAFVRKRAPKVTAAEMEYRGLGLDPGATYTAESAKEGLGALEVKAVKKGSRYRNMQRQSSLQDKELDYVELGLDATEDLGYETHFGSSNLAHTRYSLREGTEGNYILIEELQSDPLQNVVEDLPTFKKKTRAELDKWLDYTYDDLDYLIADKGSGFSSSAIDKVKSYIDDVVIPTQLNKKLTKLERKTVFKKAAKDRGVPEDIVFGDSGSLSHVAFNILSKEFDDVPDKRLGELTDSMSYSVNDYLSTLNTATTKKELPVQSISDSIRMSLQAIIADAKAKGINEIVLPPVEKLAKERFAEDEIASKIAKGSAFHNTYVAAYEKVLKQLKNELGNQIKIGIKPLKYNAYVSDSSDLGFKQTVETVEGTLLDISNLKLDPTKTKLRFNKGGLVERRTK